MARIRSIKPEFWTSEQVVECSLEARLLFIGLWNFADDAGIQPLSPKRIKMQVFPGDCFDSSSIRRMLVELEDQKLIRTYVIDETPYLQITGWERHQKIDRPTRKYPPPPDEEPPQVELALVEDSSSVDPRKGREGKGYKNTTTARARDVDKSVDNSHSRRTLIPDDYKPPDDMQARLVRAGRGDVDAYDPTELAKFVSYYRGNGKQALSWDALFEHWCLQLRRRGDRRNGAHQRDDRSRTKRVADRLDEIAAAAHEREMGGGVVQEISGQVGAKMDIEH